MGSSEERSQWQQEILRRLDIVSAIRPYRELMQHDVGESNKSSVLWYRAGVCTWCRPPAWCSAPYKERRGSTSYLHYDLVVQVLRDVDAFLGGCSRGIDGREAIERRLPSDLFASCRSQERLAMEAFS